MRFCFLIIFIRNIDDINFDIYYFFVPTRLLDENFAKTLGDKDPYDSTAYRYLDNPSVYLGGNSSAESDVGLTWSVGATFDGTAVNYAESIAFRPFWRYIDSGKNTYMNAAWRDTCYYYYR